MKAGQKHTEETKLRIKESNIGKHSKPHTEETKRKIKESLLNRKGKPYVKRKPVEMRKPRVVRNPHIYTEEERRLISIRAKEAVKKRINTRHSEETKKKIGDAHRGKPHIITKPIKPHKPHVHSPEVAEKIMWRKKVREMIREINNEYPDPNKIRKPYTYTFKGIRKHKFANRQPFTAERKLKTSLTNKGKHSGPRKKYKPMSEEGRLNIAKAHLGKKHTKEHNIKIGMSKRETFMKRCKTQYILLGKRVCKEDCKYFGRCER